MKNCYLHNQKEIEQWDYFTFLQISLMVGLIGNGWTLIPASSYNLLQYVVWVEIYEENPASYTYIVGRGRSILLAFSGNCGHS